MGSRSTICYLSIYKKSEGVGWGLELGNIVVRYCKSSNDKPEHMLYISEQLKKGRLI